MARLLVVDPGLRLFGSERALLASLPCLKSAHDAVVAAIPRGAELGAQLALLDIRAVEGPIGLLHRKGRLARARAAAWLLAICLCHRIDLIYLNQAGFCRIGHAVARILGLRTVVHVRLLEDIPRCAALVPTARAPVDVVAVSEDVRRRLAQATGGRDHFRCVFSYDPFVPAAPPPDGRRNPRSFACIGRIEPSKGQYDLVQASLDVARSHPDIRVDLIGDAVGHEDYGAGVAGLAKQGATVRLLGYRQSAATDLHDYGFLVAPTRYETLGRVIMEAWAAGCVPICSADSGGAAEIVTAAQGGILYRGFDAAALAEAMKRALSLSAVEHDRLVAAGRRWMAQNMSRQAYESALSGVLFPT